MLPPRRQSPTAHQGAYVHPFAIFSAYARTTNGGVYETGTRTRAGDSPESTCSETDVWRASRFFSTTRPGRISR